MRTEPDAAAPLLDESIALVRAGANSVIYPIMLAVRALVDARNGDDNAAYAALNEAIICAHDNGDLPGLVTALDYGIQVWARFGAHDVAATIGGVVSGPYGAFGSLPSYEIPHREQALQQARTALGDGVYQEATARGAAMSLDELVGVRARRAVSRQLSRNSGL